MAWSTRPPGRGRPMTTSSTGRSVRSLATASSSGTNPFIGTSLDEVTMSRPGIGWTPSIGRKTVWSTPTGTTVIRSDATPICAAMSVRDDCRDGEDGRQLPGDADLHAQEPEPPAGGDALPWVRRVAERELAVDGDRMVERRQERPAVGDHAEHARAEALVVVDEVEVTPALGQQPAGPDRVGPRLAEAGGAHHAELGRVGQIVELAGVRDAERVRVPVEVEPGHRREADAGVELRPRRSGEDLDGVAEGDELPGEVPGVDALAAAARVAAIEQERHPQSAGRRRGRGDGRGDDDVGRPLPRFLHLSPLLTRRLNHAANRPLPS